MADDWKAGDYTIRPQSYGLSCAQSIFGGPRGVWLNCFGGCKGGGRIVGPDPFALSDAQVFEVFQREGWTQDADRPGRWSCRKCSDREVIALLTGKPVEVGAQ